MSSPFVDLMRRYCVDYTSRHYLPVCDEIMEPDYILHMGGYDVAGRDDAYKPAAAAQFQQFPGLGLTVNEIICSGDRLALRFSEHGASIYHDGARAAWSGIGLYRWNGVRLTENFVEQDYYARRRQLKGGAPDPVETPAVAPWDTEVTPADPCREASARAWLARTDPATVPAVAVDDRPAGGASSVLLDVESVTIDDLFSAGDRVAFHAVQRGRVSPHAADFRAFAGAPAVLHLAGVVTVNGDEVVDGRIIRDRLGLSKRLKDDHGETRIGSESLAAGGAA